MNFRALVLLPVAALAMAGEVREEILVVVNNHIISRRQFQQAVEQATAAFYRQYSGKELDDRLRNERELVLQGLIDSFLIQDKAVDLGLANAITDEQLRKYVEEQKKQYNFATDQDFEKALRSSFNLSLSEYLQRIKQNEIQSMVLGMEVYRKIAIEDQELRAWYEDHKSEFKQPSRFRIRELVITKGATEAEQTAAKARLAQVQKALGEGGAFEALAKEHSDSASKATGGDLGWMGKGLMRATIEQAALALKPGQVSSVIETDKDWMLIQLIEAEEDRVRPFDEVKQQILEKVREPKAENAKTNYLNGLRTRGNIRYLVPKDKILKG